MSRKMKESWFSVLTHVLIKHSLCTVAGYRVPSVSCVPPFSCSHCSLLLRNVSSWFWTANGWVSQTSSRQSEDVKEARADISVYCGAAAFGRGPDARSPHVPSPQLRFPPKVQISFIVDFKISSPDRKTCRFPLKNRL